MKRWSMVAGVAAAGLLGGCVVGSPGIGGYVGPGGGVAAVNRPLTESEVATTSRSVVASLMQHAEAVLKFADGATVASDFLGRPPQPAVACDPLDLDCVDGGSSGAIEVDFASARADVDEFLAERVVVASQQEIGSATEVIYRLQPTVFCKKDSKCKKLLTDLPVRLRVTSTAPGSLQVAVLVTDGLAEVAQLSLSDKQASLLLMLDALPGATPGCAGQPLGCLGVAARALADWAMDDEDGAQFTLTQSSGRLRITYDKTSAVQAQVRVEVLSKLQLGYTYKQETYAAALAPSSVTAAVDAVAKAIDAKVQLGEAQAAVPYRQVAREFAVCGAEDEWGYCVGPKQPSFGGTLRAEVAGLSVASKLVRGQKTLLLQNLGLGPATSRLKHDDQLLVTVDLNANAGRVVAGSLGFLDKDRLAVELSAALSAEVKLAAAHLAKDIDFPRWLRDEIVTGSFSGPTPRAVFGDDVLQVTSGSLQLASSAGGTAVVTATGQCLAVKNNGVQGGGMVSMVAPTSCGTP